MSENNSHSYARKNGEKRHAEVDIPSSVLDPQMCVCQEDRSREARHYNHGSWFSWVHPSNKL